MTDESTLNGLALLAALRWDARITVDHARGFDRERTATLDAIGLLPPEDRLPDEFRQRELRSGQCSQTPGIRSTAFDVLGDYNSSQRKITLFDDLIALASISLDVTPTALSTVVLMHELAHAMTHLGKDADGAIWEHFSIASEHDKELFAQIYSHLYFVETGDIDHADIMRRLCDSQPEQYSSWKSLANETRGEINRRLLSARKQAPPEFQVSWSFMGYGINMGRSGDGSGLVLSDGRAFFGMDWGLGFTVGKQCPGKVQTETIAALREAIINSGVMNLPNSSFGPEAFMDGGTANMEIRLGSKRRSFEARCGDWGRWQTQFGLITKLFARAMREASRQ